MEEKTNESKKAILKRLREQFAKIPRDRSLSDELIQERREEAARENAEDR